MITFRSRTAVALALGFCLAPAACNSGSGSNNTTTPASTAWEGEATVPETGFIQQGFTITSRGDLVLAGGYDSTGVITSAVFIFEPSFTAQGAKSYTLKQTAFLPKAVRSPAVYGGGSLYVFGGDQPQVGYSPIPNADMWEYDELTNTFSTVAQDPSPSAFNYAGAAGPKHWSINHSRGGTATPQGPTLNIFSGGGATPTETPIREVPTLGILAQDHHGLVCIFGFGGVPHGSGALVSPSVDVFDITTKQQVTTTNTGTSDRPDGLGLIIGDDVYLFGGTGIDLANVEAYNVPTGVVTKRPDLVIPVAMDSNNTRVFGNLALFHLPHGGGYVLYRFRL